MAPTAAIAPTTLSTGALTGVAATSNIYVEARTSITFGNLSGTLALQQAAGRSITFQADNGDILFGNPATTSLSTQGASLVFQATGTVQPGALSTTNGNVTL